MHFLDNIRKAKPSHSVSEKILATLGILVLGIILGVFAKYLDVHQTKLPNFMARVDQFLDFHNFLGGFAPWILIAICIAVYSRTQIRAAINVFAFFLGMVASYYLYCYFAAGFFPKDYAMNWIVLTMLSPIFGFVCWYGKGRGVAAVMISALALAVLFNCAFGYGWSYISVKRWLNVLMYAIGVGVLYRKAREMEGMIALSIVFAILLNLFLSVKFW